MVTVLFIIKHHIVIMQLIVHTVDENDATEDYFKYYIIKVITDVTSNNPGIDSSMAITADTVVLWWRKVSGRQSMIGLHKVSKAPNWKWYSCKNNITHSKTNGLWHYYNYNNYYITMKLYYIYILIVPLLIYIFILLSEWFYLKTLEILCFIPSFLYNLKYWIGLDKVAFGKVECLYVVNNNNN